MLIGHGNEQIQCSLRKTVYLEGGKSVSVALLFLAVEDRTARPNRHKSPSFDVYGHQMRGNMLRGVGLLPSFAIQQRLQRQATPGTC